MKVQRSIATASQRMHMLEILGKLLSLLVARNGEGRPEDTKHTEADNEHENAGSAVAQSRMQRASASA